MFPISRTALAGVIVTAMASASVHAGTIDLVANFGLNHGTSSGTATAPAVDAVFDADNYARARADVSNGAVGIGLATNGDASGYARAGFAENWTASCAHGAACVTVGPHPVTYNFHVHGELSPDWFGRPGAFDSFSGDIVVGSESLSILFGGPTGLEGRICGFSSCQDLLPLTLTQLANGDLSYEDVFSVEANSQTTIPSSVSLAAGWDSSAGPSFLGFMDTLSYDLVSDDPDIIYTSDFGRTSLTASNDPPSTAVPEPGTLGLTLAALLGIVLVPRKKLFAPASC